MEDALLKKYPEINFKVYTVDCKFGRLDKMIYSMIPACNPAGQAHYPNSNKIGFKNNNNLGRSLNDINQ